MRRIRGWILTLCLLGALAPAAFGQAPNGEITLGLDEGGVGEYQDAQVQVVRVTLNGELVESDVPAFIRGGRTMVPVRVITEEMGADVQWFAESNEVAVALDGRTVRLKIGSAQAQVNGETVDLYDGIPAMVANHNGTQRTMVPLRFVSEQLGARVEWEQESYTAAISDGGGEGDCLIQPVEPGKKTVVLDAGHGGSQSGALYEGVKEKDINLAVTQKVESILLGLGYNVVMTRDADVDVGLYTRAYIANEAGADIFVSIHANAAEKSRDFTGIYTFHHPDSAVGPQLAQAIQAPLCALTGAIDRGIEEADFVVLRETAMCAVLVETGFMTNHEELRLLTTESYQDKLAAGIVQGIVTYLNGI